MLNLEVGEGTLGHQNSGWKHGVKSLFPRGEGRGEGKERKKEGKERKKEGIERNLFKMGREYKEKLGWGIDKRQ